MDDLCRKFATKCPDIAVKKKEKKNKVEKSHTSKNCSSVGFGGFLAGKNLL